MDIAVRLSVRRDVALTAPQFRVPPGELGAARAGQLPRLHGRRPRPDGGDARRDARGDRRTSATRHGRDRAGGLRAAARVAADLRIHEVVDAPNWVVGCFVPEAIFDEEAGR